MHDVFISYTEIDHAIVVEIADRLESAGVRAWYFERDNTPGKDYLKETRQAVEQAKCFFLIASAHSLVKPHQISLELVRAHESGVPIIPFFCGVDFQQFRTQQPDWHHITGARVGIQLSLSKIEENMPRILRGLKALGIQATEKTPPEPKELDDNAREDRALEIVLDESEDYGNEDVVVSPDEREYVAGQSQRDSAVQATIVHEHAQTGFLADAVIHDGDKAADGKILLAFNHALLKSSPFVVAIKLAENRDPIQYYRLREFVHGYPLTLRLHWPSRLPSWSTFSQHFGLVSVPPVKVMQSSAHSVLSGDSAGILLGSGFHSIIGEKTSLPRIVKKRVRTRKGSQKAISIVPATQSTDGKIRSFAKMKVSVAVAAAGVAWLEFTYRVDPDGRYTIIVRDPLHGMQVRDAFVVQ